MSGTTLKRDADSYRVENMRQYIHTLNRLLFIFHQQNVAKYLRWLFRFCVFVCVRAGDWTRCFRNLRVNFVSEPRKCLPISSITYFHRKNFLRTWLAEWFWIFENWRNRRNDGIHSFIIITWSMFSWCTWWCTAINWLKFIFKVSLIFALSG